MTLRAKSSSCSTCADLLASQGDQIRELEKPMYEESATRAGLPQPDPVSDVEVIAAIRGELWEALRGREIGGDRTLVGMVKRLGRISMKVNLTRVGPMAKELIRGATGTSIKGNFKKD